MGKWHGKNKSNKQKRDIYLASKTNKLYLLKRNSINLPIIFYCKFVNLKLKQKPFLTIINVKEIKTLLR